MSTITKEEFEKYYANNSQMSVAELRAIGLESVECNCGMTGCKGWKMIHRP